MEDRLFYFTHAYFPTTMFDEYSIEGRYAFARVGNTYVALIGLNQLYLGQEIVNPEVMSTDDLIQDGTVTYWITEASSSSRDLGFDKFKSRIKNNTVKFDEVNQRLTYTSNKTHELTFKENYLLNGNLINLEYDRMDSPYAFSRREAGSIIISFNGETLYLDFYNQVRREY